MPLYEYLCSECDNRFERIEKASTPSDGVCPSCGGAARRLLGSPALRFKGSGWYVTDYGRSSGGSGASQSESSGESTTEASSAPAADSNQTAAKTDSKVA